MYRFNLAFLFLFVIGCNRRTEVESLEVMAVPNVQPSGGAYFTQDHLGNAVLCWTTGEDGNGQVSFATYNNESESFDQPIVVLPSKGTGLHSESMNKIAFKADGTIIAVFERKHPTEKNKYAGSILYSQSFDKGKTWTGEKFIHTDTTSNSRSFFDIATLPDGEVGAIWVDGRLQLGESGSSLFFSKTKDHEGFTQDRQIGETVCECCRTDLYTDPAGNVHILYRDIESSIKGQIRDFAHAVSLDSGATFSTSRKVSEDNWNIDGCPHTGASMSENLNGLAIVWFTAGGLPGLYYTFSTDNGNTFQKRQLISEQARHPQIASNGNELMIVWDESKQQSHQMHAGHDAKDTQRNNSTVLAVLDIQNNVSNKNIIDQGGEFPVLSVSNSKGVLVAYTKNKQVVVRRVKQ